MATVTKPPILDDTGQGIVGALDDILETAQLSAPIATLEHIGKVKPDGITVRTDNNGVLTVVKSVIEIPRVDQDTFTYDGSQKTLTFININPDEVLVTDNVATNAGTYTCTCTLKNPNAVWSDRTAAPKTYNYTINKAAGSIVLSPSSVSLTGSQTSVTVDVTIIGDGVAVFGSNDTSIATVTPDSLTMSGTITISGTGTNGDTTISAVLAAGNNYTGDSTTCEVSASYIPMKTFAAATDAEIAEMVAAADAGLIDLYEDCGWRVGQEHTTTLSAIAGSGTYDGVSWTGRPQPEQSITFVLLHRGLYQLQKAVKNKDGSSRNTCSFVVGLKGTLSQNANVDSSSPKPSWRSTSLRTWLNSGFVSGIPSALLPAFKQFYTTTGYITDLTYGWESTDQTVDRFSLAAEKEIHNTHQYSITAEANLLTQFSYYEISANRMKSRVGMTGYDEYWNRSVGSYNSVNRDGTMYVTSYVRSGNPYPSARTCSYDSCFVSPFGVM